MIDLILMTLVLISMAALGLTDARRMIVDPRLVLALVGAGLLWRLFGSAETGSLRSAGLGAALGVGVVAVPDRMGAPQSPALAPLSRRCDDAGRPRLRSRTSLAGLGAAGGLPVLPVAPGLAAAPPGPLLPEGLLPPRPRHGRRRHGGVRVPQRRRRARGGRHRCAAASVETRSCPGRPFGCRHRRAVGGPAPPGRVGGGAWPACLLPPSWRPCGRPCRPRWQHRRSPSTSRRRSPSQR